MTTEITQLTVHNEAEAFDLIERALQNEMEGKNIQVGFEGWPVISLRLQGEGYESTITAAMAESLVDIQAAVNRTYARYVHGSRNGRKLTAEERQRISFKAKVEKGSSKVDIDLTAFATELAKDVVGKMSSTEIMIVILSALAVAGGTFAFKGWLKARSEDKKVSEETKRSIALSQEETRRAEVMARAISHRPDIAFTRDDFDDARHGIVKGAGDATLLEVNGIPLDRESARVIAMTKRSESKAVQLNGTYLIKKVDWQHENEVRITVSRVRDAVTFQASFTDNSLEKPHLAIMKDAEWSRNPVYLSINGTELRGEITTAVIISVEAQPAATFQAS
jgi:hypothetical protein